MATAPKEKRKTVPRPKQEELSPAGGALDITQPYVEKLLQNPDKVLRRRGAGDLQIYEELLRDDQVASTWQQRRQALTGKEILVEPGGERPLDKIAAGAFQENMDLLEFDRITDRMMYGLFFGYAVGEVLWVPRQGRIDIRDVRVRRQKRFAFGPQGELYLLTLKNPTGELMPDRKFWVYHVGASHDDNPYGVGLGHYLYWPIFFKRNDIKYWLIFLDKFGMPTAVGKMPRAQYDDPVQRKKVKDELDAIQKDSAVAIPEGTAVELIEAARSGTADYKTLLDRMNAAVSKIILSQTMTTDDGSSRSQSDTHKEVRDEVLKSDGDILCGSFNQGPVTWWTEINFPGAAPPQVWRKIDEDQDQNELADRDQKIRALGYDPTPEYITDTYGQGWTKRPDPPPGRALEPQFAELEDRILEGKRQQRLDQQSLKQGSQDLANQYQAIVGPRLEELLGYLEETGDLITFRERLNELLAEPPREEVVETIQNSGMVGRLMGLLKAQR